MNIQKVEISKEDFSSIYILLGKMIKHLEDRYQAPDYQEPLDQKIALFKNMLNSIIPDSKPDEIKEHKAFLAVMEEDYNDLILCRKMQDKLYKEL